MRNLNYVLVAKGKFMGKRVLSPEDVQAIRSMYSTGLYKQKELATLFKVRQDCISRIVKGEL